jgi:ribosomal protein S19E (S16A)
MEDIEMAKTKAKTEQKPPADGNRYTRAARVLAKNDKLSA